MSGEEKRNPEFKKAKRILFLTTSVGSGHKRAAEAIQAALGAINYRPIKVQTDTYFDYFLPVAEKVTAKVYVKTIQLMRQILKYMYSVQKKGLNGKHGRYFLSTPLIKKYEKAVRSFNPDAIVCTQALSSRFISILKENGKISASLIAVMTDFDIHPYWLNRGVDKFIVPTDEIKEGFITYGIPADKIYAFGIPIHPNFSKSWSKPILKEKLGLIEGLPVILIMGGGWGLGPIKKVVLHLDNSGISFQLIVVTGKNRILKKELDKISPRLRIPIKVYGYVSNIDELMEVSDIAVTKPGGLISSELLAKGLPAILVDVIPGQEEANGEYLISKGAACKIERINQLKEIVQELLENPAELEQMRRKAKMAAKPLAAVESARLIMESVDSYPKILELL